MISCLPAGACTPRRQAYFVPAFAPCVTAADIRAQESVFCRAPCNLLRQKGKNYMNQTLSLTKLFSELCDEGKFQKIIFSDKRKKSLEYQKVILRPILLGGELCCQAEYTYPKKVTHRNLPLTEAAALCLALCEQDFKQINIFTPTEQIQVLAARPERPAIRRTPQAEQAERGKKLRREGSGSSNDLSCEQTKRGSGSDFNREGGDCGSDSPHTEQSDRIAVRSSLSKPRVLTASVGASAASALAHNRQKHYLIPDGVPCDFLIRLGVMSPDGKVFPKSYAKFRQINRYLEIVEDVFPALPKDRALRIIDFGCGKAYLTFAIYYYLKILQKREVEIIGLDLKEDVIDFCNRVAADLGYDELKFLKGDIADYTGSHADMVVTLHACDTATDYALINAVKWNTKVILSVPCCQHELFKQIKNELHQPMLKHGILKDRLTEYLTDGLRGLKLEACGYHVSMIEFTSLEHTARNIMIKAVKSNAVGAAAKAKKENAQRQYEALRDFYQVHPTIDQLTE